MLQKSIIAIHNKNGNHKTTYLLLLTQHDDQHIIIENMLNHDFKKLSFLLPFIWDINVMVKSQGVAIYKRKAWNKTIIEFGFVF